MSHTREAYQEILEEYDELFLEKSKETDALKDRITELEAVNKELRACHEAELGVCFKHCDEVKELETQLAAAGMTEVSLREALDDINYRDTYNEDSYGVYAKIARTALSLTPSEAAEVVRKKL